VIENAILYNTTLKRMTPYLGCTLWTTYSQRTESHLCNGFMYVALFFLIHLSMCASRWALHGNTQQPSLVQGWNVPHLYVGREVVEEVLTIVSAD
jgi:hypothetical protein